MIARTKRQDIAWKLAREEMEVCGEMLNEVHQRQLRINKILFSSGFISEEQYEKVKKDYSAIKF